MALDSAGLVISEGSLELARIPLTTLALSSVAAGKALLLKAYIADGISDARAKKIKRQ